VNNLNKGDMNIMKLSKRDYSFVLQWAKKIKAIELLGGKCSTCNCKNEFCLEFHHPESNGKKYGIGQMLVNGSRWSDIEKELSKCVLLCRNCHSEIHCNPDSRNHQYKKHLLINIDMIKCYKCGYRGKNLASLDFHHTAKNKRFTISAVLCRKISIPVIDLMEEIDKCDIICSNCHVQEQILVDKFKKFKDLIYKRSKDHIEKPKPIDVQLVTKMLADGSKQIEIATRVGCAKSTISEIIKRNNLKSI